MNILRSMIHKSLPHFVIVCYLVASQCGDEESEYHKYFVEELGIEHPDDMSAEIVKQVYKKYNEKI